MGISFGEDDVEVIEWNFNNIHRMRIRTSKEEVLEQVLFGLKSVNKSLGMNYKLYKIYFGPFDILTNLIYSTLIVALIRHYHIGNEFSLTLKNVSLNETKKIENLSKELISKS